LARVEEEALTDDRQISDFRSQYALRLYGWAQKHLTAGTKRISLEEFRKVLGLESIKDADGKTIQAPLQLWANFRQRALDVTIAEVVGLREKSIRKIVPMG
jgi:hypothetical protein